jgi:hypothetical protein
VIAEDDLPVSFSSMSKPPFFSTPPLYIVDAFTNTLMSSARSNGVECRIVYGHQIGNSLRGTSINAVFYAELA